MGCIINVIAAEPGTTLQFHLSAPHYPKPIALTVDMEEGATTHVEVMHVSRKMTSEAMLFFHGTVQYAGDAASNVELVYDEPRIIPVSTKQLTGEFAGYTEVDLQLGQAGVNTTTPFPQLYPNDDPYVAQAVWEIAQLKDVDWKAALAAPLPPSGLIVQLVAPPEIQRKHKKLVNV